MRRGTSAEWGSSTLILKVSEWGIETDTGVVKIGDGAHLWPELPTFGQSGATAPRGTSDAPDYRPMLENGMM